MNDKIQITATIKISISMWDAIKLRISGPIFTEYVVRELWNTQYHGGKK